MEDNAYTRMLKHTTLIQRLNMKWRQWLHRKNIIDWFVSNNNDHNEHGEQDYDY